MGQIMNYVFQRVQVGRDADVPIETDKELWFLWVTEKNWDAHKINYAKDFLSKLEKADLIFCVWHGTHRTNLFLMQKESLILRLRKIYL